MAEITKSNGQTIVDYMARDYDSLLQAMRSQILSKLPEWTEYADEADFGNVLLQLFAHMGDILSYYQDRVANESFLGTARERRSIIHHLRLIGYRLATAAPASTTLTLTLSLPDTYNEVIRINKGDAFATKSQKDKPSVRFEYRRDAPLTIEYATLPVDPVTKKRYYQAAVIPVEEGRLVQAELLGTSDGTPNQRFTLGRPGLILRSLGQGQQINRDLVVTTQMAGGGVLEEWIWRDSLAFSREEQRDVLVEINEHEQATIVFGDGAFGAIPPKDAQIRATYRVGGGLSGNVSANSIQTIVGAPQLALLAAQVTNALPATGGADRETIEHAVAHAPSVFRSLKRAVTAGDYEALALDFNGVGKVRARPASWNTVTLFIAPVGGGQVSDVLEANLLAYFEDKRPISTVVEIEDVSYVDIYVTASLGLSSYYERAEITEQVKASAGNLLAFDQVDFGQALYLSKFYEAIEAIEGIDYAIIPEFRRSGQPADTVESTGKIELSADEIPRVPDNPDYASGIKVVIVEGGY
jgi:hypothetical protein